MNLDTNECLNLAWTSIPDNYEKSEVQWSEC